MPTSREQLNAMLDAAIEKRAAHRNAIGAGRRLFLIHVKDLIRKHGFPLPEAVKLDACSMPYIFQELIYDGYSWSTRTAELGHLADMVEVDVIVWSGGRSRKELTDAEYHAYWRFTHDAMDYRSRPPRAN
jgi:hypothetical protein